MMSMDNFVLANARLVLADQIVDEGWVGVSDGQIVEVGEGAPPERAISIAGDTLIPGLVELHTDHLECHIQPRPKVAWNTLAAVLSYDAQIAASGITTVYDCLRVGVGRDNQDPGSKAVQAVAATLGSAAASGYLRSEHHTHLRCEVCSPDVIDAAKDFISKLPVDLMSLMDHTPGQRQYRDLEALRIYYRGKTQMSEQEIEHFFAERHEMAAEFAVPHRRLLVALSKEHGITLASHDDTTPEHVSESLGDGVAIAEFPTTQEAAQASHEGGIAVMMGAPNLVRGGSHAGNVAAEELARSGTLDIFSSDYVPSSLVIAAFQLPNIIPGSSLPEAIAMVTRTPAEAVGMRDRGVIAEGHRADLVRIHADDVPVVRTVWREGRRVA